MDVPSRNHSSMARQTIRSRPHRRCRSIPSPSSSRDQNHASRHSSHRPRQNRPRSPVAVTLYQNCSSAPCHCPASPASHRHRHSPVPMSPTRCERPAPGSSCSAPPPSPAVHPTMAGRFVQERNWKEVQVHRTLQLESRTWCVTIADIGAR